MQKSTAVVCIYRIIAVPLQRFLEIMSNNKYQYQSPRVEIVNFSPLQCIAASLPFGGDINNTIHE